MSEQKIHNINSEQKVTFYFCGKHLANNSPKKGNMNDAKDAFAKILRQNNQQTSAMYTAMQNIR